VIHPPGLIFKSATTETRHKKYDNLTHINHWSPRSRLLEHG